MEFLLREQAADAGDGFFVLELAEVLGVVVSLQENLGKLLLFLRRLVLLLAMLQQHVNLADQQSFRVLKLWNGKGRKFVPCIKNLSQKQK